MTRGNSVVTGSATRFTLEASAGSNLWVGALYPIGGHPGRLGAVPVTVASAQGDSQLTLAAAWSGASGSYYAE
jgi:hypothetical protein